ncbi:MAG: High-affinity branched-chain amino acid transport ATP-binding protein LivF [Syntrophomonadaceae bacterium]|nr:High-affinity branched-chain amino acid transport ATP-binding protein LivF [Bacillota bacterium]
MLLEVKDLSVSYDMATILSGISINVQDGELVGLVGPNGAGKTTLLRAITGLVKWEKDNRRGQRMGKITLEGQVSFMGEQISNLSADQIARRGLVHCPERRRPFKEMSVYENILAGAYLLKKNSPEFKRLLEEVYSLFPILKDRGRQISATLSGGEQQMLAIARSLMGKPKLLCIDEPSVGLAPIVKRELFERIAAVARSGITVLLVEQDVAMTFAMSNRNYVLSHGRLVSEGTSEVLLQDEDLRKSYLGL